MAAPNDETAADLPVRDLESSPSGIQGFFESSTSRRMKARQAVSRITRQELEDRYLQMHDEHFLLKQQARKQEDKIKRMATKLIRLVQDKKKAEQGTGVSKRSGKDVELEEMIEQLQENVRELEKQKESLHNRLIAAKQQLQTQGHRHAPYNYVQSRINSGLRKVTEDVLMQGVMRKGMKIQNPEVPCRSTQAALPRYGHSLLEEARAETRNLENVIASQRNRIDELEHATDVLKDELQRKDREHEETFLQLREQQTTGQRATIKENVVLIKLQKQLTEKNRAFAEMESKFHALQENLKTVKANQDYFLNEVDKLNSQLKEERLKSFHLEKQLQSSTFSQKSVEELLGRISDLEKERDLLKENSDKLYSSAFTVSSSQEQQRKLREQQLKLQIAQLEAALKSDLADKNEVLERMRREREHTEKLDEENKKLHLRCLEQKHQIDEFQNRLKFFTKESDVDVSELSEALMLIKKRKQQMNGELKFLEKVEDDVGKDLEKSLRELQANHVETVQELEKTRNMLIMQHKINKDYQVEVEAVTQKMEGVRRDYEIKLEQYAHLLDVRAARIRKLEAQLKDIAYGTKQFRFTPEITKEDDVEEFDEAVHLERGYNLLEIHISKAVFSPVVANIFGDQEPATFCTYAFYDFELQTTPIVRGLQPSYEFTSQYLVQMDDFFLQYIQKSTARLEVHLAIGTDFKTIAVCQLRFQDILEKNGEIFSSSTLIGIDNYISNYGTVEYWVRLKVPMEQAIRLYKERAKALGYISSNQRDPFQSYQPVGVGKGKNIGLTEDNLIELFITINSCNNLKSGTSTSQPSPYVAYTFFHFPDHYTNTITNSNNPQFDDLKCFPLSMNADVDRYLKSQSLVLYVFDDREMSNAYTGKAMVPLIPLAHDKCISGTFQLTDFQGNERGTIKVILKWKTTYLPPSDSILSEPLIDELHKEIPAPVRSLKDEEVHIPKRTMIEAVPITPMPKPRVRKSTADKRVSFIDANTESLNPVNQFTDESVNNPVTVLNISEEHNKSAEEEPLKKALKNYPNNNEESSQLSDGQYEAQIYDTSGDETEVSEDMEAEDHDGKQTTDGNESTATDSDDCIIPAAKEVKPLSEKICIEILSLNLDIDSEVVQNEAIKKLFVEHRLGNLPAVETLMSLPKPRNGQLIHYNHSNALHLDKANNQSRRDYIKSLMKDPDPSSGSIKFTVVSDPPEDEQDLECDDIGFSNISLKEILQTGKDVIQRKIEIYDSMSGEKIIGKMTVTVEAAEALRSLMQD
ncbi:PREDICTED: protein fantom [Nanorana parkeri]|uniref:protein fantom n=1 Tax=Nanorana parkeri TaxID=125878 RepID=UPI000854036B|nr:PREDICTED: protein fantom [Nanorana parkeri]